MNDYKEYKGKRVELMLTSKCNINCSHCYISYAGERDVEELYNIVSILKNKGYQIKLNGAENLTNLDFLPIYEMCGQTMIISNGIIPYYNPEVLLNLLNNKIDKLYMSYHFDLHDKVSIVPKDFIETNIKNGNELGIKSRIMTTISMLNYKNILSMCNEAYKLGANGIAFTNFIESGNALSNGLNFSLSANVINDVLKQIEYARNMYDINEFRIERCGTFGSGGMLNNFCCHAGIDNVTITPDNNVYMCNFMINKGDEIGIFEDNMIKLYHTVCNNRDECIAVKKLNMKGR